MSEIKATPEIERIAALPRRRLEAPPIDELTDVLRTPGGLQRLREVQAHALLEGGTLGGFFGPIGVGEGKTLIALLLAYVLDSKRPLLLMPANLIKSKKDEQKEYAVNWRIPNNIRMLSYEWLGRKQAAQELEDWKPDLIMCDEAHNLKNRDAARTRRVERWMKAHPETRFVPLSGTMMTDSFLDFWHLLVWSLKEHAPVPRTRAEAEQWALALDKDVSEEARFRPGALLRFAEPEDYADGADDTTAARRGFQRRLLETPGVVAALSKVDVPASIYVRAKPYKMSSTTNDYVSTLRGAMLTPDEWELTTGAEVWMHARQLSLGFHSVWNPRPPDVWRRARREWCSFVREVLSRSRTLDSPEQVADACAAGKLPRTEYDEWLRVQAETGYKPRVAFLWHDDSALKVAAEWMKSPGIVWTEHVAFAQRLAEMTGCTYYGRKGLSADGRAIEKADPRHAIIASVHANKEGRNLQELYHRNLITSPPSSSKVMQQLIARTHRPGLIFDEVIVDVMLGCSEHINAWRNALAGARVVQDMMGEKQKLLLADVQDWPTDEEISQWANRYALWQGGTEVFDDDSYVPDDRDE